MQVIRKGLQKLTFTGRPKVSRWTPSVYIWSVKLALAASVLPVPLCGGTGWSVDHANKYLSRDICSRVRSTFGMAHSNTCPSLTTTVPLWRVHILGVGPIIRCTREYCAYLYRVLKQIDRHIITRCTSIGPGNSNRWIYFHTRDGRWSNFEWTIVGWFDSECLALSMYWCVWCALYPDTEIFTFPSDRASSPWIIAIIWSAGCDSISTYRILIQTNHV